MQTNYLLSKPKFQNSSFKPRTYFIKLSKGRKKSKLRKSTAVTKTLKTKAETISFVILANKKYFKNLLRFLVLQSLSNTELLEKVFLMYLIAIHCNVKENLNAALLYIPAPQNDINEINLVY